VARRRYPVVAELDLVPMMSVIVHLIPMLMLSVRFVFLAAVPTKGPVIASKPAANEGELAAQQAKVVSVLVARQGFVVGGNDAADPRIPCKGACAPDTYDYAALTSAMVEAKRLHPTETRVVIAPEPDVSYDTLVRVMDATRSRKGAKGTEEPLFPDALLASGAAAAP
jgi:biopolymer transport protein ExbD